MERERTQGPPAEQMPATDPTGLHRLIADALALQGMDRFVAAGKINDLLIAMRAPGNETAEGQAILSALDVASLEGLVDGNGRACRKEAVETLLACGFPMALRVSPDDLAYLRASQRTGQRARRRKKTPAGWRPSSIVAGLLAGGAGVWEMFGGVLFRDLDALTWALPGGVALFLGGWLAAQVRTPRGAVLPAVVLGIGTAASIGALAVTVQPSFLGGAVGGTVGFLILAAGLGRRPQQNG